MNIWGFLGVLGLVILFGTVGAADLNAISTTRMIVQGLLGLGFMCVGVRGALKTKGSDE